MEAEKSRPDEGFALERVADAAREVQVALAALKVHFSDRGGSQPSTLELARFAAAMQELKDAREAFDQLIGGNADRP